MMLQQLLQDFSYFALFPGTFFEGGTTLVLAGFLAFCSYTQLDIVVLTAFLGSYAGDQLWYFPRCHHGRRPLAHGPRWQKLGDKTLDYVRRHPDLQVLSLRFVYGLRTAMSVVISLSGYSSARYLLLSGIGAIVWVAALGSAVYYSGSVSGGMLGSIKKCELTVLGGLIVLGLLPWP